MVHDPSGCRDPQFENTGVESETYCAKYQTQFDTETSLRDLQPDALRLCRVTVCCSCLPLIIFVQKYFSDLISTFSWEKTFSGLKSVKCRNSLEAYYASCQLDLKNCKLLPGFHVNDGSFVAFVQKFM